MEAAIRRAAAAIAGADALLIAAGAGMGVDSGLPDFRGPQGFWRAYPPYEKLGLDFYDLADPRWFRDDPAMAWGFYGHRRNLYRATGPHDGFAVLRRLAASRPDGAFVLTSNVDGLFARAGFDPGRIVEVHGAIDWCQCVEECGAGIFPAGPESVAIDESTMRAAEPLPSCPGCGGLARPNILMFGDGAWHPDRTAEQRRRLGAWLAGLGEARLAIVECGAGTAVPTVRLACESAARSLDAPLVRINRREPEVPGGPHVGLPLGALDALRRIDAAIP